jgi:hypothetical protein
MIDGQFDSDRGYIFSYAATAITASVDKNTAFLIRLAPSVSNAQIGDLGERELLNRAQLLLSGISLTSDTGTGAIVVEGVLNPANYPTDPTRITWTGLASAASGGQPSFAQIAAGGSVTWSGGSSQTNATVQGAFTTTVTAISFAPVTTTLTATAFNTTTVTGGAPAITAIQNATYTNAFSNVRNDFLVAQSTVTAWTSTIQAGDLISVPTFLVGGQRVQSITNNFITINSVVYARIVMNGNASATSGQNTAVNGITFTVTASQTYAQALSTARTDFLVPNTQITTSPVVQDVLSATTFLTGGQTISTITQNFVRISNVQYARITMGSAATASSTTGAGNNVSVTSTSAVTATYGRALSTARTDFLITDAEYASSGIAIGDTLSLATFITGGQTIIGLTQTYLNISGTNYARVVMSAVANSNSTSGAGNNQSVTVTAAGSAASYTNRNFLFFTSASWLSSGAAVGTRIASSVTSFPAGSAVQQISTRTFGGVTVYRVTFNQSANTTINAAGTITFQFGAAYALPGEQVFSFIANPGETQVLPLEALKELTATAIGGRGTFPNGPDVLAINLYKVSGTNATCNVILRWGEAQA